MRLWIMPLIAVNPDFPIKTFQSECDWYYAGKRNDIMGTFERILVYKAGARSAFFSETEEDRAPVMLKGPEAKMLTDLWTLLASCLDNCAGTIAGWRINDIIWPKLVNRSLALHVDIPYPVSQFKMKADQKWPETHFIEAYTMWKQGIYDRPEIQLHDALEFWNGCALESECELMRRISKPGSVPEEHIWAGLMAMASELETAHARYNNEHNLPGFMRNPPPGTVWDGYALKEKNV